jgi:glucose/arabinose dehydrogenase
VLVAAGCDSGDGAAQPAATAAAAAAGVELKRVGRFSSPIYVTAPRGDGKRLFVVERGGRIRLLVNGKRRSRPFLDISSGVGRGGERGLLSMAFARDYASSGRFFVYFTGRRGDIHIQEFRRSSSNPDLARRGSRRNLLTIGHREFGNHNGGQLQVGPDGYLYAGVGDGGGAGDPHRHGQSLATRLGKLLRIDPRRAGRLAYRIPKGNPFRSRRGARREIWAYGLRNPWRFSFDRSTGALAIGDVGQDRQEEVDFAPRGGRGANYGWSVFEGTSRYREGRAPHHRRPALVRSHARGWCAITGGYVVRDRALRGLYGRYVYGDLCHYGLRSVTLAGGGAHRDRAAGVSVRSLVSFGEGGTGRIYAVSLSGSVYRLAPR